jgi:hypothetical protein
MYISGAGNVGIGTTSPGDPLTVIGKISSLGGTNNAKNIKIYANDSWGYLTTTAANFYINKSIRVDTGKIGSYDEDLQLQVSGNTKMYVNSAGNVGIGTTNPDKKLDIKLTNTSSGTYYAQTVGGSNHLTGYAVGIGFDPEGYGNRNKVGIVVEGTGSGWSTGHMHFVSVSTTGTSSEATIADAKMTITSNGNVGIGTTSPTEKLDVSGDARVTGTLTLQTYPQTQPVRGQVYSIDPHKYIGGVSYWTWTKIAQLDSAGHASLRYNCKGDINYPHVVAGWVTISSYASSSINISHQQLIASNPTIQPQIWLDNNRDIWIRMVGASWTTNFQYNWEVISPGVAQIYDGTTQSNTQPANSTVIEVGQEIKFPYTNTSAPIASSTYNPKTITGNILARNGDITLEGTGRIQGIDTVSAGTDAASKAYVDAAVAGGGGGGISGTIAAPINDVSQIAYATAANTIGGEAGFTYNTLLNTLSVEHLIATDNITVGQEIYHAGDTDTYIQFTTDTIKFVTGARSMIESSTFGTDRVVINEAGQDIDFRVESNANAHMLFVDGGLNRVGINQSVPSYTLDVNGDAKISGTIVDSTNSAGSNNDVLTSTGSGWSWQPASGGSYTPNIVSGATTASKDNLYIFTASATLTLPANPSGGDSIKVSNLSGTTTCVIARNAKNIMAVGQNMTLDNQYASFELIYTDATRGWVIIGAN